MKYTPGADSGVENLGQAEGHSLDTAREPWLEQGP